MTHYLSITSLHARQAEVASGVWYLFLIVLLTVIVTAALAFPVRKHWAVQVTLWNPPTNHLAWLPRLTMRWLIRLVQWLQENIWLSIHAAASTTTMVIGSSVTTSALVSLEISEALIQIAQRVNDWMISDDVGGLIMNSAELPLNSYALLGIGLALIAIGSGSLLRKERARQLQIAVYLVIWLLVTLTLPRLLFRPVTFSYQTELLFLMGSACLLWSSSVIHALRHPRLRLWFAG